jgi:hypothetical protein
MVESAAAAPEQYIAINTAKGFMGNVGSDCRAFVEARERLDFFKVLSPPVFGTAFILCRRRASILCKRFLKPVAGFILRL